MTANIKTIINFINFQVAWFACVLGAAHAMPWLGVAVTIFALMWHFYASDFHVEELKLAFVIILLGGLFDQFMLSAKLIEYQQHGWGGSQQIVPVWILALWAGFASSLNVSLRWMRNKTLIALLFGFFGGPLAYLAAERLGAVTLNGNHSLLALAVGWAIMMPILLKLSTWLDGFKLSAVKHA
jgi:Protein of unknown function (DUF2878)